MSLLAFVVPLIHPASCRNWDTVLARLDETVRSIAACTSGGKAIGLIVANQEAQLPNMPSGIDVLRIDLKPPEGSVFVGEVPEKQRRKVKRLDKGTKVLEGCYAAVKLGARYLMTVDADDLVSRRLPEFVATNTGPPGWYLEEGWVLPVGARWAYREPRFSETCGTSLIIRSDLLCSPNPPQNVPEEKISRWFGAHKFLKEDLAASARHLKPLPFPGAVYRTGHSENATGKGSIRQLYFSNLGMMKHPIRLANRLARLERFGASLCNEFHGGLLTR